MGRNMEEMRKLPETPPENGPQWQWQWRTAGISRMKNPTVNGAAFFVSSLGPDGNDPMEMTCAIPWNVLLETLIYV